MCSVTLWHSYITESNMSVVTMLIVSTAVLHISVQWMWVINIALLKGILIWIIICSYENIICSWLNSHAVCTNNLHPEKKNNHGFPLLTKDNLNRCISCSFVLPPKNNDKMAWRELIVANNLVSSITSLLRVECELEKKKCSSSTEENNPVLWELLKTNIFSLFIYKYSMDKDELLRSAYM